MTCNEAAEYVSALCDHETIPQTAAEHIGTCASCQSQLRDYLELGAELRRAASVEAAREPPPLVWQERNIPLIRWWKKGKETMRIPKYAFASLLAGVAMLGSSLAIVGVRVHADARGTVLLLTSTPPAGTPIVCPLSTVDPKNNHCGYVGMVKGGWLLYRVKVLSSDGQRAELGVRSRFIPQLASDHTSSTTFSITMIDSFPQENYALEPGKNLVVNVPGAGNIMFTGEWTDHVPAFIAGSREVDPGPGEIRITSPLLLSGNAVLGDMEGGGSSVDESGSAVMIYYPGQGSFVLTQNQRAGAVEAVVKQNRISFESDGRSFSIITGAPITREQRLWVVHDPAYRPAGDMADHAYIGSENAQENQ